MFLLGQNPRLPLRRNQPSPRNRPPRTRTRLFIHPGTRSGERKFVVAKKKSKKENPNVACKCKEKGNSKKCLCVAYENLRASQEEFFKNRNDESDSLKECDRAERELEEEIEKGLRIQDGLEGSAMNGSGDFDPCEIDPSGEMSSSTFKRRRDKLLEEARKSVPERGKVMHLVQAFEKLLSIPSKDLDEQKDGEEPEDNGKKAEKWALPGLQPPNVPEAQVSSSSFCPSDLFLTSENLGLDRRPSVSSSWDGSVSSRTSHGGRRSRRNSSESSSTMGGRTWKKKQLRATSLKPFKLRTEERGRQKEEEFMKKIQEMMIEEERQRIPIAQGLPWTTDEPECLMKPPVKDITIPTDLKLYSDMRAVERAEFDHQVAEKMNLFEQYKMERERLQKLAEEEEIRRLRKELVPKAQPMPYFDRPFIPRRSMKHPTIPKEPSFMCLSKRKSSPACHGTISAPTLTKSEA
ncbi:uncharacterized protein Pyn_32011 [Prunus yedoensis var. nudiflora]|uniref:TPX2 C-terminal domain-containing protein n=1 Tax=Prunus yedoensis var. nudiflora TaxID=2094558 RepID=A0A314Z4B2_PRUYE|nr:uncharacterized protein Pyn_32011 [Prunus yedoensis var. nudiflora]